MYVMNVGFEDAVFRSEKGAKGGSKGVGGEHEGAPRKYKKQRGGK